MIKKAVVIGGNHHNTLGVVRSLGRANILSDVVLVTEDINPFVLKSKYVRTRYVVSTSNELLGLLQEEYSLEQEKPVIISCSDEVSSYISSNRQLLESLFVLPGVHGEGTIANYMDKAVMNSIAANNGLSVPHSKILQYLDAEIDKEIIYPCITKPLESSKGSKNDIVICEEKKSLIDFLAKNKTNKYLVQEYIDKKIEFQLIGCSLDHGARIIIPGKSVILRQPSCTNTGFLHYSKLDDSYADTVEKTKQLIAEIGYSGLFSAEFIRDESGTDYFMEINFRNDGNAIAVTNAGVNLPVIWYKSCANLPFGDEIKDIHEEFVMPEFAELSLYIEGTISKKEWKADMRQATTYMDYDEDDPAPTSGWNKYRKIAKTATLKRHIKMILRKLSIM